MDYRASLPAAKRSDELFVIGDARWQKRGHDSTHAESTLHVLGVPGYPAGLLIAHASAYRSTALDPTATGHGPGGVAGVASAALEPVLFQDMIAFLKDQAVVVDAIVIDGDSTVAQFFKDAWPDVRIILCLNHWLKAVRKWLAKLQAAGTRKSAASQISAPGGQSFEMKVPTTAAEVVKQTKDVVEYLRANGIDPSELEHGLLAGVSNVADAEVPAAAAAAVDEAPSPAGADVRRQIVQLGW